MSVKKKAVIISGYAGSGKDTVAEYIEDKMKSKGSQYHIWSLGDAVRDVAQALFAFDYGEMDHYFYNYENKNSTVPGIKYNCRKILQIIGNEMRELFHADIWCENILKRTEDWEFDGIIIPDNRYPNETEFFRKHFDVVTIRVNRDGKDGKVGISNHPSESNIIPTDIIIDNNGTLEELYEKVDSFIAEYL